jgi:hypothetical protein
MSDSRGDMIVEEKIVDGVLRSMTPIAFTVK